MEKNLETNLRAYAYSFLGVPYRWGGSNPISGLDCSGLVIELLKAAGVIKESGFDTTAQGLYEMYSKTGLVKPDFGALSFYGKNAKLISHVGFCLDDKSMIEAGGGGSAVVDKTSADVRNAFVRIRPIYYRSDFLFSAKPNYKPKDSL